MSVSEFPGKFRVGALNEPMHGVTDPAPAIIDPKFMVMILHRGIQRFVVDGEWIEMDAGLQEPYQPVAYAGLFTRRAELRFEGSWGDPFRKIAIAGPHDWFKLITQEEVRLAALPNFPTKHLEHQIWHPGEEVLRLSNQIVFAPPEDSEQQRGLFRMSRALEILRRLPSELEAQEPSLRKAKGAVADLKTIEKLRLYVMENLSEDLSLAQLEERFGLNRRSIQRRFRAEYGLSLADFLREAKLNAANDALQKDGVTISKAAHLAGYTNNANFATAFKRQYGISPSEVQNRNM